MKSSVTIFAIALLVLVSGSDLRADGLIARVDTYSAWTWSDFP
jgi:hypothetical protein